MILLFVLSLSLSSCLYLFRRVDSPLEFFKTELSAENTADKVRSLRRTKVIASVVGVEESWKNLLPILLGEYTGRRVTVFHIVA